MSSIIDQLIDEELQITQHPNKDMIISAIGNPDFLITFSDVNKVGINPRTKFNTPAGIYGWHFDQATIDGAKRNEIFASGRKYGHLMKVRDGAKVLWLGDDRLEVASVVPGKGYGPGLRRVHVSKFERQAYPSMVLTCVLAESCMSAGPKSVAPVSRPETHRMTLCIRCSMKGRTTTMRQSM